MDVRKLGTRASFFHFLKFTMNFLKRCRLNMSQLLKYRSRVFPTIFPVGVPWTPFQPKVKDPEVKVGDTMVSIEQQTKTKIKDVL